MGAINFGPGNLPLRCALVPTRCGRPRPSYRSQGQKFARLVRPCATAGASAPRIVRSPHAGRCGGPDPGTQSCADQGTGKRPGNCARNRACSRPGGARRAGRGAARRRRLGNGQRARPDRPHPLRRQHQGGRPVRPADRAVRPARHRRPRLLRRPSAADHQAAPGRHRDHLSRDREPGHHLDSLRRGNKSVSADSVSSRSWTRVLRARSSI